MRLTGIFKSKSPTLVTIVLKPTFLDAHFWCIDNQAKRLVSA